MRSKNKNTSYFDENFEVTYEDDLSFDYDTDPIDFETQELDTTQKLHPRKKNPASTPKAARKKSSPAYDYENEFYDDLCEDDYMNGYDARQIKRSRSGTRRRHRPTRLAAPIQKGGNAMMNIARMIIRNLTLFLMLAILILMGYNFLRGSAPYGDIENAVSTNTYTMTLAAYFSVAAALVFYEIISMLWAMTKVRVRDEYGTYREDVGRGLFSFVFLYLCSHLSFFINDWIPESVEFLKGLRGALDVFGSMHNVLFGLCLAGVISCLFRKYSISL